MIEVRNLHYRYPGNLQHTIKEINFQIQQGEIFGFLGPSGAGKSTLQKVLIGILKNYEGSVQVAGEEINKARSDYYEKIGVAFEFPNFYHRFTALENLEFFRSLYSVDTADPMALLSIVGLENYARTKVSDFSKGMKMRLNLCRALLNRPELIFLDEPTSGLDPANAKKVKSLLLEKKAQGGTILITTHNMNVAEEICDRVAFIVDGRISLIDSPRELKIQKGRKIVRVEYKDKGMVRSEDFPLPQIGMNETFLRFIREKDIETMHTQEKTLEQIFIEVTGRDLA
ncbi:ABC transporter ATP-binding protein [Paenactinomyces guangxiensis]|uniref:ABC transporter ATP-binding protein n=1 Tax=Paenactinomyces guangxiensis TaxID=1490290 RepID=A0A7W2A9D5_9BACL|nr:ABC transporter ATP-binding protein [Paenactinomyces guangxiensis]MBA4495062.1 ABC transporter ATP-binding protein [Paenactinomyces guangxiensis]MBH8592254.1 ABC transporter ATP-binding protein [Paenactinomyces guangxiensis]